jgi:hypothetical protein
MRTGIVVIIINRIAYAAALSNMRIPAAGVRPTRLTAIKRVQTFNPSGGDKKVSFICESATLEENEVAVTPVLHYL